MISPCSEKRVKNKYERMCGGGEVFILVSPPFFFVIILFHFFDSLLRTGLGKRDTRVL